MIRPAFSASSRRINIIWNYVQHSHRHETQREVFEMPGRREAERSKQTWQKKHSLELFFLGMFGLFLRRSRSDWKDIDIKAADIGGKCGSCVTWLVWGSQTESRWRYLEFACQFNVIVSAQQVINLASIELSQLKSSLNVTKPPNPSLLSPSSSTNEKTKISEEQIAWIIIIVGYCSAARWKATRTHITAAQQFITISQSETNL